MFTIEQYWPFMTNSNTIHTAKTAIPIQYQLKLLILVYETWIIEYLDIGRPWKMGSGLKQIYSSVNIEIFRGFA